MKKLLSQFAAILLTSVALASHAALPPAYLQVKNFELCLAKHQVDTYVAWCMPAKKSASCPSASWKQLQALSAKNQLSNCPEPSKPIAGSASKL